MSYYAKGHHAGERADDFDDHDPTPYGGGYDISVTYGHSLPPSDSTCFPPSSSSVDYSRPQFSSSAHPSAYSDQALSSEYQSYSRPKTRPGPGSALGSQQHHAYPNQESGHGGYGVGSGGEFGSDQRRSGGEFGSGQEARSDFGSGYGRKSEGEEYGRKKSGYGDGEGDGEGVGHYGRGDEGEGHGRGKYGRSEEDDYKRNSYDGHKKSSYERRKDDDDDDHHKKSSYERRSNDDDDDDDDHHKKSSYERRRKDDDDDDDDDKKRHGRKKHGDNDSDNDDDDKKKKHHHKHHDRKHYDD